MNDLFANAGAFGQGRLQQRDRDEEQARIEWEQNFRQQQADRADAVARGQLAIGEREISHQIEMDLKQFNELSAPQLAEMELRSDQLAETVRNNTANIEISRENASRMRGMLDEQIRHAKALERFSQIELDDRRVLMGVQMLEIRSRSMMTMMNAWAKKLETEEWMGDTGLRREIQELLRDGTRATVQSKQVTAAVAMATIPQLIREVVATTGMKEAQVALLWDDLLVARPHSRKMAEIAARAAEMGVSVQQYRAFAEVAQIQQRMKLIDDYGLLATGVGGELLRSAGRGGVEDQTKTLGTLKEKISKGLRDLKSGKASERATLDAAIVEASKGEIKGLGEIDIRNVMDALDQGNSSVIDILGDDVLKGYADDYMAAKELQGQFESGSGSLGGLLGSPEGLSAGSYTALDELLGLSTGTPNPDAANSASWWERAMGKMMNFDAAPSGSSSPAAAGARGFPGSVDVQVHEFTVERPSALPRWQPESVIVDTRNGEEYVVEHPNSSDVFDPLRKWYAGVGDDIYDQRYRPYSIRRRRDGRAINVAPNEMDQFFRGKKDAETGGLAREFVPWFNNPDRSKPSSVSPTTPGTL